MYKKLSMTIASQEQLKNKHYYHRLWMAVSSQPFTRRGWLDELADTFRDYEGVIFDQDGKAFEIPLVDEVFGDDPDMRWLSYYLQSAANGDCPKSRSYKFERLQLFDLYFKIKFPKIARHFPR